MPGVDRQVENGDVELIGVDENRTERWIEMTLDPDVAAEGPLQQSGERSNMLVEIDLFGLQGLTPGEGEQLLRQRAAISRALQHLLDQRTDFRIGGILRKLLCQLPEAGFEDGDQIVEVMNDAGCDAKRTAPERSTTRTPSAVFSIRRRKLSWLMLVSCGSSVRSEISAALRVIILASSQV
ncbi:MULTISPECIES: hypothetical protein [unclassified Mesorhizobium]|uniref:hypothetical protein n=1 Tax=unclassified Mesorhizobium TaxID=325217 RepID=UPI003334E590